MTPQTSNPPGTQVDAFAYPPRDPANVYAAVRELQSCDLLLLRHRTVDPIHLTAGDA